MTAAFDAKALNMIKDLPAGYKRTEVGVIPSDWDVERIDRNAAINTGSKNTQDRKEDGYYPFFVRSQEVERINSYSYDGEAVLTAGDGVGTGKVFHYIQGRFDVHQRVYRITEFSDSLNGRYFYYQFGARFYDRIMSMTAKSSVDSVRLEMIAGMKIPIPPPDEQCAIAEALQDVDNLLESLSALIAKKWAIKQAAMQQLLTGKTRLPDFEEEWEMKRICDLLDYERPDRYIVQCTEYSETGDIPVLTANKSFILGFTDENFGVCTNIPAIVFDDFTTDCKYAMFPFKVKSSAIKLLRARQKQQVQLRYVFERMKLIHFPLGDHKRYYISDYQNIELHFPACKEQYAIVAVLSDIDSEISALEQHRKKTLAVKQGMMQQLLTGRVRLVEPKHQSDQGQDSL